MEQFSFQGLPVLGWLFESTIYISILICLIFIIKTLTKNKLPVWWSYCLWLLLIFRMLIPFGFETRVSVYNYIPAPPENSSYMPYLEQHRISIPFFQNVPDAPSDFPTVAVPPDAGLADRRSIEQHDTHESTTTGTSDFNLSYDKVLLLLWFAGVLAFGLATIYKNCKFWLIVKREQSVADKDILDLFSECRRTLGLQKSVEIIVTGSVKSPAIFGYFKPQLLLPVHFLEALKKEDLYCVFLHELGHVKRHDIGVSWLATFFQVIYWFNPLLWYAFHHLRADQEAACDAYVLSKIKEVRPTDYARTIVNLLQRFVQNRQLPSLAGIIENKSQIDRRISMILDYKRITQKVTIVSVLMLFIVAGIFFSCSNGRLSDRGSDKAGMTQPEKIGMKHYKSDDWNFSLDIPGHWKTPASLPVYLANKGELISFGSNDDGLEALRIFMYPCDPKLSLNEDGNRLKKQLKDKGYGNFITTETAIGSRNALILDYDKEVEGVTLHAHTYLVPYKSIISLLNFATTRPDPTFELYDRIAQTYEFHELPVAQGIKKYVSPDGNIAIEIPANWNAMPPYNNNEIVRFGTPQHGVIAVIFNLVYAPWDSLEDARTGGQEVEIKAGWKNFTNSETVINERRTLILDGNNDASSLRTYYFENGGYKCVVGFFASTKNGIPADRLKVYERVIGSIVIRKKPEVTGFEEYAGPDLKKPLASGTKRYVNPDDDYTVDVPGDWHPYAQENGYAKTYLFGISGKGLAAVFYPRSYSPGLTLDEERDNRVKAATDAGWKILGKSEIIVNRRKTLIFDSKKGPTNIRNYLFKDEDFIYSVLFYAYNTEGIPDDRVAGYEKVIKSINIINAGQDLENSPDSDIARTGTLSLQFRFAENKPDMGLEEMTSSGSGRKLYLHKESVLSNEDIKNASAISIKDGFAISLTFTEAGEKKFAEITKENVGRILGIVMDDKLINAPVIRVPITGGRAIIQGKFTLEEAKRIARGILGKK